MAIGDRADVVVVGAGVCGLTAALRIRERGHSVAVLADAYPPHTTSNVAGALWYPHRVPADERVSRWCTASYAAFRALAHTPASGVGLRPLLVLLPEDTPLPPWAESTGLAVAPASERPKGYGYGFSMLAPVIESDAFLEGLLGHLRAIGVATQVAPRPLAALATAFEHGRIVVNASGLGARRLAGDDDVRPIRGQVLRLEGFVAERSLCDDTVEGASTYVIARERDCIAGVTYGDGDWNLDVYPGETVDILARATRLVPELQGARVAEQRVGLRPARSAVRLETEATADGLVVHDYGHGGGGVTLSFGCAEDVADLVDQALA